MVKGSFSVQRFPFLLRFFSYICSMLILVTKITSDFLVFFFSKCTIFLCGYYDYFCCLQRLPTFLGCCVYVDATEALFSTYISCLIVVFLSKLLQFNLVASYKQNIKKGKRNISENILIEIFFKNSIHRQKVSYSITAIRF
jgi:hypothetical protein